MYVVNEQVLNHPTINEYPFKWMLFNDVIRPTYISFFAEHFPENGFSHIKRNDNHKQYSSYCRMIFNPGNNDFGFTEDLLPEWQRLISDLSSVAYRDIMSEITNTDLCSHRLEITLWRYDESCFFVTAY